MKVILAAVMFLSVVQRNAMAFAPKFLGASRPPVATFASASRAISDEVLQLINSQVTVELSASQLYLSASIWCDQQELVGMAAYVSDRMLRWIIRSYSLLFVFSLLRRSIVSSFYR